MPVEITSLMFGTVDSVVDVDCKGEMVKCPIHLSEDGTTATLDECNMKKSWIALANWSTEIRSAGSGGQPAVCTLSPIIKEKYADDLDRARRAILHGFDFDKPLDGCQSFKNRPIIDKELDDFMGEKERVLIYWPSDGLSTVINATFEDGWNSAADPKMACEQGAKMTHLILWTIAAHNSELEDIILRTMDPETDILFRTSSDICRILKFIPRFASSSPIKSDNRVNRLARILVGLGMIGKHLKFDRKDRIEHINKWMRCRMRSLFADLRETVYLKDLRDVPKDDCHYMYFLYCNPDMVESLVHYILEIDRQSNALAVARPIDVALMKQVKMLISWSGLVGVKIMNDFLLENKTNLTKVLLIETILKEGIRFLRAFNEYVMLNGVDLAPYGRLLNLPLVKTLNHSHFPNLLEAAVLASRMKKKTYLDYNYHSHPTSICDLSVKCALDIKIHTKEEAQKRYDDLLGVLASLLKNLSPSELQRVIPLGQILFSDNQSIEPDEPVIEHLVL